MNEKELMIWSKGYIKGYDMALSELAAMFDRLKREHYEEVQ